jgi:hypothetical protein
MNKPAKASKSKPSGTGKNKPKAGAGGTTATVANDGRPVLDPTGLQEANKAGLQANPEMLKLSRAEIRELKKKIEEEEKLMNFYNLEKEKINNLWIIGKKEIEDHEANLKNKEREEKDLEENHVMTTNFYKQKIKHLLFQNEDYHGEMKIEQEKELKQGEDQNRVITRDLDSDNRDLLKKLKEQELSHNNYIFSMKFENQKNQTLIRQEFERACRELTIKYDLKKKTTINEMEDVRNGMIKKLEDEKEKKIKHITSLHATNYKDIKNYYNDITTSNLSLIKQFKTDIQNAQEQEEREQQRLQKMIEQNQRLEIPLKEITEEIARLLEDEKKWKQITEQKKKLRGEISNLEQLYRELEYQYEVKLQHFHYLDKERNKLFERYEDAMYDIHQKSGLRNLILEKKLSLVSERIEVKDAELNQVLAISNIDEGNKRRLVENLEEIHTMKNQMIADLQDELRQIRGAHVHMVKAYDGKLSEFVIPVEELGFNPLVPSNVD